MLGTAVPLHAKELTKAERKTVYCLFLAMIITYGYQNVSMDIFTSINSYLLNQDRLYVLNNSALL